MYTLYDGKSDINWIYDGLMSYSEMANSDKYRGVTTDIVVLRTNNQGKVYDFEYANEYALRNGEVLDPINPEKTIDKIHQKKLGTYIDLSEVVSSILMEANLDESRARSYANFYPEWQPNINYKQNWVLRHNGSLYKVNQDHTSAAQWVPGESGTESLYTNLMLNDAGYQIWKQPTGAHDAYNTGDIVEYKGTLYKSLINGNVWAPDAYPQGWKKYDASTSTEPSTPDPGTETPTEPSETDYPEFVQPTGAHDAYKKGDIVRYNGKLYQSLIDGNAYSPDAYPQGWQEYSEE